MHQLTTDIFMELRWRWKMKMQSYRRASQKMSCQEQLRELRMRCNSYRMPIWRIQDPGHRSSERSGLSRWITSDGRQNRLTLTFRDSEAQGLVSNQRDRPRLCGRQSCMTEIRHHQMAARSIQRGCPAPKALPRRCRLRACMLGIQPSS